jgi:EmrB/QacA subfamily drug resistance transporter
MSMVAIEATVVATAMPQIVAELGGLTLYSWVFSAYLLSQTALTVVFGKLADIYGRKPIALFGIAVFLTGSVLAGFAATMPILIVFRLIQGIGAGAMQPAAMTIIADLYPGKQRAKIQGYLSSVWAVSAIVGPLLGGIIVHNLNWSWVFWVNVPIGLLAAAGFVLFLHEEVPHRKASVDIVGAVLGAISVAALMVLLTEASDAGLLFDAVAIGVFLVTAALFVLQERRAPDPMISFRLWAHRPIATANVLTLVASMALIGLTTFVPIYVQGVLGQSALVAGFTLTTMMIGWPTGAMLAARANHRLGARPLMLGGSLLQPVGALLLSFASSQSSPILLAVASLVMGLGMGMITINALLLVQGTVEPRERGIGTASNLFARNLGSTLGAAVLGAVFNFGLASLSGGAGVTSDQLRDLLDNGGAAPAGGGAVQQVLEGAVHWTFLAVLAMTLLNIFVALAVPKMKSGATREREAAALGQSIQES